MNCRVIYKYSTNDIDVTESTETINIDEIIEQEKEDDIDNELIINFNKKQNIFELYYYNRSNNTEAHTCFRYNYFSHYEYLIENDKQKSYLFLYFFQLTKHNAIEFCLHDCPHPLKIWLTAWLKTNVI